MGQIVHDISAPNDGLGDQLRQAFEDANTMNAELYATKVDVVAGYGLSKNDFTDALKTKLDNLATDAQKNVQSDWNELDPTSDAFILGKPVFESNEIAVSAIWTSGLKFDVTADLFPINNISYAATPDEVTLDAAHATLDRIDLIVAVKPISPATVGTVGFIKGTPATTALVVPPDFDSSLYYVIKQVIIRDLATTPEGVSTTQIYDEGVEWTVALSANLAETTNDPSVGTKSLEGTNTLETDYALFTAPSPISTADIGALTFDFKNKEAVVGKKISIEVLLAGVRIEKYDFGSQENGYFDEDSDYQSLFIDKSKLNLPLQDFDEIRIQPFFDSTGYFIDNVVLHTGSGSETVPTTGIPEAPIDGVLYGRKDSMWEAIPSAVTSVNFKDKDGINLWSSDSIRFEGFDVDVPLEKVKNPVSVSDIRQFLNGVLAVADTDSTPTNEKKSLLFRTQAGTIDTSNPRWFEMVANSRNVGAGWDSSIRVILNESGSDLTTMEISKAKVKFFQDLEVVGDIIQSHILLTRDSDLILNAQLYDGLDYTVKGTTSSPYRILTYRAAASGGSGWHAKIIFQVKSNSGSEVDALEIYSNDNNAPIVNVNGLLNLKSYTVSTLPTGSQGDLAYVTDSNDTITYRSTVSTGSGSGIAMVFHDGTNWIYH